MKYFKDARVFRLKNDKLKITWNIKEDVEVSIFSLINNVEKIIGKVKGKNEFLTDDFFKDKRSLFILKAERYNYEIVGERLICLGAAGNLRDIGGYKSKDGRRIKWNLFYKCNKLYNLTNKDTNFIKSMNVKTLLDLRSNAEVKGNYPPKIKGVTYLNLSSNKEISEKIDSFDIVSLFKGGNLDNVDAEKFILNSYRNMVFDNIALKKLIEYIENEDSLPIIFMCSTGKDITELSSAIILAILDIPRNVIKEDYVESNYYRKNIDYSIVKRIKERTKSEEKLKILDYMLEVKGEFIDKIFAEVDFRYGSFDNYLEKEYGLTRKKRKELKKRLLY